MRILIAGCGYVGSRLAQQLAEQGHEVFCIQRSPGTGQEDWFTLPMNLCEPIDAGLLPTDLDAVYYLPAARNRDADTFNKLYTQGPTNLYQAVSMSSSDFRFTMVSTTGVYTQEDGSVVDEESLAKSSTESSRALLTGEYLLANFPQTCVLRFSGIYGPGRHRLISQVQEGRPIPAGMARRFLNQIHVEDCVGTLRFALEHPELPPRLIASDEAPTLRCDVLDWLAQQLNKRVPEESDEGLPPGGRGQTHKQCSSQKIRDMGYRFIYPTFREGYGSLL